MKLSDFSLFEEKDQERLYDIIQSFNQTKTEYPGNKTVHQVFTEQAVKTPDAVAVSCKKRSFTYKELDQKSNRLARLLIDTGWVVEESFVGVMLDRSSEMIVALLGILKAGGAYLPINHDYPFERIKYMLNDTRAPMLISESRHMKALNTLERECPELKAFLCTDKVDVHWGARVLEAYADTPLDEHGHSDGLAYVMYTSGTTGRPKGVMIEHRSILRLVLNTDYIHLGTSDRILQTGSLAFDASTFEIWGPLLNGGSVCLPPGSALLDAFELKRLIKQEGITTIFLTTGLFNQLVEVDINVFKELKTLFTGGEKVSARHINTVRKAYPSLALKHVYGPTENTTFTTCYDVNKGYERNIPIGRPIANTTVYILDNNLQLAPIGVPGELCTGGDGLSRGYLNAPELTRAKFIPHPFEPGKRLYRTGDLARWMPGGNIEFLGRIDNQVKVRGYRIELEEIETRLLQTEAIKETVVLAIDLGSVTKDLVAYITASEKLNVNDLRNFLKAGLPDYMTPSYFIQLDQMPLNQNGKVDRKALPLPEPTSHSSEAGYEPLETETEKKIGLIWEEVLGCKDIGATHNFFDIGGHSLKLVKLVSLIHERMNIEIPLTVLFTAPTIRENAAYIADAARLSNAGIEFENLEADLVLLSKDGGKRKIFIFPTGSGFYMGYEPLSVRLPSYSVYSFNFIESDNRLREYADRITEVDPEGPYVLLGWSAGGKLAFQVAKSLENRRKRVAGIVMMDSARYVKKISAVEERTEKDVADFVKSITSRVIREKTARKMRNYRLYIANCVEHDVVNADIHLVTEENAEDDFHDEKGNIIASRRGWKDLTHGVFRTYQGYGRHKDMMDSHHAAPNLELIRDILDRIVAKGSR